VKEKCIQLYMFFKRYYMSKHDFIVYYDNMFIRHKINTTTMFTKHMNTEDAFTDKTKNEIISSETLSPQSTNISDTTVSDTEDVFTDNEIISSDTLSPQPTNILETIASDYCKSIEIDLFSESGCTGCCALTRNKDLIPLSDFTSSCRNETVLDVLMSVTTVFKKHLSLYPFIDIKSPLIDQCMDKICKNCIQYLKKDTLPKNALANGMWLGDTTFHNIYYSSLMLSNQHDQIKKNIFGKNSDSCIPSGPGGGLVNMFSRDKLEKYMLNTVDFKYIPYFMFDGHMTASAAEEKLKTQNLLQCQIPINKLISNNMSLSIIKSLCREHNINLISRSSKAAWISACSGHHCKLCDNQITTFSVKTLQASVRKNTSEFKIKRSSENKTAYKKGKQFPPSPPSTDILETIANNFCKSISANIFSESGCTVCCMLTRNTDLMLLFDFTSSYKKKNILDVLMPVFSGTAVIERHSSSDPIIDIEGPIINKDLDKICKTSNIFEERCCTKKCTGKWYMAGRNTRRIKRS
jgi:hypothetical protein